MGAYSNRKQRIILEALVNARGSVPFREARKVLEMAGFKLDRISGSHHIFVNPNRPEIFIWPVRKGKVKSLYVRKAIKMLFPDL